MVISSASMKKILVIEDESAVLDDVLELLGFEGFEVHGAVDGLLGLRSARSICRP
jgi:CheY-like chemotaxis protein